MSNIINLAEYQSHISGEVICMVCKHEWIACAQVGTVDLDCQKCGTSKGHFKYPCSRDEDHWTCRCGSVYFCITPGGYYCPNCGVDVRCH